MDHDQFVSTPLEAYPWLSKKHSDVVLENVSVKPYPFLIKSNKLDINYFKVLLDKKFPLYEDFNVKLLVYLYVLLSDISLFRDKLDKLYNYNNKKLFYKDTIKDKIIADLISPFDNDLLSSDQIDNFSKNKLRKKKIIDKVNRKKVKFLTRSKFLRYMISVEMSLLKEYRRFIKYFIKNLLNNNSDSKIIKRKFIRVLKKINLRLLFLTRFYNKHRRIFKDKGRRIFKIPKGFRYRSFLKLENKFFKLLPEKIDDYYVRKQAGKYGSGKYTALMHSRRSTRLGSLYRDKILKSFRNKGDISFISRFNLAYGIKTNIRDAYAEDYIFSMFSLSFSILDMFKLKMFGKYFYSNRSKYKHKSRVLFNYFRQLPINFDNGRFIQYFLTNDSDFGFDEEGFFDMKELSNFFDFDIRLNNYRTRSKRYAVPFSYDSFEYSDIFHVSRRKAYNPL